MAVVAGFSMYMDISYSVMAEKNILSKRPNSSEGTLSKCR